jgi:signal transduction histidine kinase
MRARLAWALVVISVACVVVDAVITATWGVLWSESTLAMHGWPLVNIGALGSSIIGALIVSRYPAHPIGWLLCIVGISNQLAMVLETYSIWVVEESGPERPEWAGHVAGWLSLALGAPLSFCALTLVFLVAPDGHFLSRRWRAAAFLSLTGLASYLLALFTVSPLEFELNPAPTEEAQEPLVTDLLFVAGLLIIGIALIVSVVSMVRRLRMARGVQRQQLRWIAFAAASLAASFAFLIVVQGALGYEQGWVSAMPLFLSYVFLPVFMGIAILHHRLYDIDLIINRTLVLAIGTGFAAIGYIGLVVVVGRMVGSQTGGFWPSLLASTAVALAFQPLRRWVVEVADRIAYGERAVPYETLADFSRRLGASPDPRLILPTVAQAAGRALSARRCTVTLQLPGAELNSATWPADAPAGGADHEVPVQIDNERFGCIIVTLPPGRSIRAGEAALLGDLADQAALALRNASMDAELGRHLEDLDRRTKELGESRRRIVEARDSERRRLEAAISDQVISHLVDLPDSLETVANGHSVQMRDRVSRWLDQTNEALESLRELTRGVCPTQLARSGLQAALPSYLARAGITGRLTLDRRLVDRRFGSRAESAAYFCVVEGLGDRNASAHGDMLVDDGELVLRIHSPAVETMDLQAMIDRVEAVDGSISMSSAGGESLLTIRLPVARQVAEAQAIASSTGPNRDLV